VTASTTLVEAKPRATTRFPGFDGLRAIAALSVAAAHAAFISGFNIRSDFWGPYFARLDIGVATFFLISGFLLYRPFVAARFGRRRSRATGPYFRRRFLRIFPAYWVALTLVIFLLPRSDSTTPGIGPLIAHYTLTHIYFRNHVLGPLQQSWTLATEISFYILLPVYAAGMRRMRGSDRRMLAHEMVGLVLLYAISVGFRLWVLTADWQPRGMFNTWLIARTDLFALGMWLAVLSVWWSGAGRSQPRWLLHRFTPWVSWGLALLAFHSVSKEIGLEPRESRGPVMFTSRQELEVQLLYGAFAFFLLVPAVFGQQRRDAVLRLLTNRTLQWLGLVSYGLYLWHEAALDAFLVWWDRGTCTLVGMPCAWVNNASKLGWHYPLGIDAPFVEMGAFMLVVSIVIAAVSYYAVERPALRLKDSALLSASKRRGGPTRS